MDWSHWRVECSCQHLLHCRRCYWLTRMAPDTKAWRRHWIGFTQISIVQACGRQYESLCTLASSVNATSMITSIQLAYCNLSKCRQWCGQTWPWILSKVFHGEWQVSCTHCRGQVLYGCSLSTSGSSLHHVDRHRVFFGHIVKLHDIPSSIVSGRDLIFTGHFWQELFTLAGVKLQLMLAFHLKSDGQSEATNKVITMYLRCLVGDRPRQ
jgi:hypothetical protein